VFCDQAKNGMVQRESRKPLEFFGNCFWAKRLQKMFNNNESIGFDAGSPGVELLKIIGINLRL